MSHSNPNGADYVVHAEGATGTVEGRFHTERERDVAEAALSVLETIPDEIVPVSRLNDVLYEREDLPNSTAYEVGRVLNRGLCHQIRLRTGSKFVVNEFGPESSESTEDERASAPLSRLLNAVSGLF